MGWVVTLYQTTDNSQRTTVNGQQSTDNSQRRRLRLSTDNRQRSTVNSLNSQLSILSQLSTKRTMENRLPLWKHVVQIVINILTAIATTFGVQSCLGLNPSSLLAKFLPLSSFKSTHTYFQLTPNSFREKRRSPRGQQTTDNRQRTTDNRQQTTDNGQQTTVNSLNPSLIPHLSSLNSQLSTLYTLIHPSSLIPNRYKYSLIPRKNPITREVVCSANLCAI